MACHLEAAEGRALAGSKARLQPSQAHPQWPTSVGHASDTKNRIESVSLAGDHKPAGTFHVQPSLSLRLRSMLFLLSWVL